MTIQLARALTDLTVIATSSPLETQKWVNKMGAYHIVDDRQLLCFEAKAMLAFFINDIYSH